MRITIPIPTLLNEDSYSNALGKIELDTGRLIDTVILTRGINCAILKITFINK